MIVCPNGQLKSISVIITFFKILYSAHFRNNA